MTADVEAITAAGRLAIHAWVVRASGLAASSVIWAQQGGAFPGVPYITINVTSDRAPGGTDEITHTEHFTTIAPITFVADATTDALTATAHGLATGDGPIRLTTTGTLPGGLALGTDYWIIKLAADTFKIATTFANAMASVPIDITTTGTGVHTLTGTATTRRVGEETIATVRGERSATLSIQCFAPPRMNATSPLASVRSCARLPSYSEALITAGVGIARMSEVRSLGSVVQGTVFEPRGLLEVLINGSAVVTEFGGVLEHVEANGSELIPYFT